MLVGIVNTAVVVQMKCREPRAILRKRELGLREASLMTAVVAEFKSGTVEMRVNIVDKVEKSVSFSHP